MAARHSAPGEVQGGCLMARAWRGLVDLHDRIENSWVGDLIGVVLIFAGLELFLLLTPVM